VISSVNVATSPFADTFASVAGCPPEPFTAAAMTSTSWSGPFPSTTLPVVGRVSGQDRLWVSGGYSGHGNVLAFMCGDLVAKAMLGEPADELELFDPGRLLTPA